MQPVAHGYPLCEHRPVRARSALILALCLILVVVRGTGMHAHLLDQEPGEAAGFAGLLVTTVSEDAAEHLAAHLHHGDIDVDTPAKHSNDLPSLEIPVAILAFLCGLLLCLARLFVLTARPLLRPPAHRRWRYFTPLSHAPPAIA